MWVIDFLKALWASYAARKAAKAASDLPAGQAASDQIAADGKTIEAQLAGVAAAKKPALAN